MTKRFFKNTPYRWSVVLQTRHKGGSRLRAQSEKASLLSVQKNTAMFKGNNGSNWSPVVSSKKSFEENDRFGVWSSYRIQNVPIIRGPGGDSDNDLLLHSSPCSPCFQQPATHHLNITDSSSTNPNLIPDIKWLSNRVIYCLVWKLLPRLHDGEPVFPFPGIIEDFLP